MHPYEEPRAMRICMQKFFLWKKCHVATNHKIPTDINARLPIPYHSMIKWNKVSQRMVQISTCLENVHAATSHTGHINNGPGDFRCRKILLTRRITQQWTNVRFSSNVPSVMKRWALGKSATGSASWSIHAGSILDFPMIWPHEYLCPLLNGLVLSTISSR